MTTANYIVAANGKPFTDYDAADYKRSILSAELGEPCSIINHPDGGYAVLPFATDLLTDTESATDKQQFTQSPLDGLLAETTAGLSKDYQSQSKFNNNESNYPSVFILHPAPRAFLGNHLSAAIGVLLMLQPHLAFSIIGLNTPDNPSVGAFTLALFSFIGLVLALISLGRFLWIYAANRYEFTANAIASVYGIVSRKSARIAIQHIRSVDVHQSILERMLGVGTVKLASGGTDTHEVTLRHIAAPMDIQREIQIRLANLGKTRFIR